METTQDNEIKCLDDGYVRLVDYMPRIAPEGRTIEFAIVQSARVSYGLGLKSEKEDRALIRYLMRNRHTSPFETVKFKFHIRAPKFVSIQLERHRTANINELSQRYSEIKESFYHPSVIGKDQCPGGGIRLASDTNKQGSDLTISDTQVNELRSTFESIESKLSDIFSEYKKLLELGVSKEVARFCLPISTYTELYYTMDLHNLMHFLSLRMDSHAQPEIQVYAKAMYQLIKPLVPTVMECFDTFTLNAMTLSKDEVEAIIAHSPCNINNPREKKEFIEKYKKLGLDRDIPRNPSLNQL